MLRCKFRAGGYVTGMGSGVTSDAELIKAMKGVSGFRGVFSKDEFIRSQRDFGVGDSFIVNLDSGWRHGGTHWVAIRIGRDGRYLYKDSFGLPPFEGLIRDILYTNRMEQRMFEDNCGQRSVALLKHLSRVDDDVEEFKRIG